jgi:hypothetical protein
VNFFDEVTVVTDVRCAEEANMLRTMLEAMRLRVRYVRLVQRRQVASFFSDPETRSAWTILMAHGDELDGDRVIGLELVDNPSDDPKAVTGWEQVRHHLSPAVIADEVKGRSGVLISWACGGGDAALADAFLRAGYQAYVGTAGGYYDSSSSFLFLTGLFHFLMAEDRDEDPRSFLLAEAVERAAALDADWPYGTGSFRCFGNGDL